MDLAENGITGWRVQFGVFPDTCTAPSDPGNGYQVAPDGTTLSLSIRRLTDDNIEEAIQGMERALKGEQK